MKKEMMNATNTSPCESVVFNSFWFERNFSTASARKWTEQYFWLAFAISAGYMILIFAASRYMRKRQRITVKRLLITWNAFLAAFSFAALIRCFPVFWYILHCKGFQHTICGKTFFEVPQFSFWLFWFALFKAVELGDTLFIIARKQKLIFLHWYHHILTLIYSAYSYKVANPTVLWSVATNSFIHTLMYGYYALRVAGYKVPTSISMFLTSIQIAQMAVGIWINVESLQILNNGSVECGTTYAVVWFSLIMYFSYFCLFVHFFYSNYFKPAKNENKTD